MDIGGFFKGIGDFFGGIFGKKVEDENKQTVNSVSPPVVAKKPKLKAPTFELKKDLTPVDDVGIYSLGDFERDEPKIPKEAQRIFDNARLSTADYERTPWDIWNIDLNGEQERKGMESARKKLRDDLSKLEIGFDRAGVMRYSDERKARLMKEAIRGSFNDFRDRQTERMQKTAEFRKNLDEMAGYIPYVGSVYDVMKGGYGLGLGVKDLMTGSDDSRRYASFAWGGMDENDFDKLSEEEKRQQHIINVLNGAVSTGFGTVGASGAYRGAKMSGGLAKAAAGTLGLAKQAPKEFLKQSAKNIATNTALGTGMGVGLGVAGNMMTNGGDFGKAIGNVWDNKESILGNAFRGAILNEPANRIEDFGIDMMRQQFKGIDRQIDPAENPVQNAVAKMRIENEIIINRLSPNQMKYNVAEIMGAIHGDARQRMGKAAFSDLQKAREYNPYATGSGMDVESTRNGNRKMTRTSQKAPNEMFNVQQILSPVIGEALAKSQQIDTSIDSKNHGFAKDGFTYHEVPVKYAGKDYSTVFDVGTTGNKNTVYNATTRKSPMEPAGTNPSTELHHLGDSHKPIIQQDSSDVKMKILDEEQIGKNDFSKQNLRRIIGEEYDIITKTPDGKTRNAQGYADLKNGIVAVLDGKMATANHEATHVAVYTLKQSNSKLADNALQSIIRRYGAEELVNNANKSGYGETIGYKLDFRNEADVRYAAEERLADDFAKYAEAKAKGRENYYVRKTGLPAQIKAWFDNAIDRLKDMAGRLDSAHNFMYKLERGDFAEMIDAEMRARVDSDGNIDASRPQMAYKIDPETNIVHIDNNIIAGVPKNKILNTIKKYLQDNLQGGSYSLDYGKDGEAKINARTKNKFTQLDNYLPKRGMLLGDLPDILKVSKKTGEALDSKSHSFAKNGFEYRSAIVEVDGKYYDTNINIGVGDNGKILYTINKIKEVPQIQAEARSRGEASYDSSIPQDDNSVKMKLGNVLHDKFGNEFSEEAVPVEKLRRNSNFQPRTTVSGKGTSDSVFKHGYDEGRVDQPMLLRAKEDGTYEVLGGHSRTEGLERRTKAGLENPKEVMARVYRNIDDRQAMQISQAANQGGQYESIIDMAKSISDARQIGIEPSVQRQNMVKGFSFDDYQSLHDILSKDRNIQDLVFHGAISQEDMLSIARTAKRINFDPSRTINLVREAYSRGNFNRKGVEAVMKALSTRAKNIEMDSKITMFDFMNDLEALDTQDEIMAVQKELKNEKTISNSLDRVLRNIDNLSEEQIEKLNEVINLNSKSIAKPFTERGNTKKEPRNSQGMFSKISHDSRTSHGDNDINMKIAETSKANFDVNKYIKEQIKAQKQETGLDLMQKVKDFSAKAKHYLVDDAVAHEAYIEKGKGQEDRLLKEALRTEIRNDIDRVRSSEIIARQFIIDNGLTEIGKLSEKEANQFQQFLIAKRHVEDLANKGIETGRSLEADRAIVEKYQQKFAKEEEVYRRFNENLLAYMQENGLISKRLQKKLGKNKAYAPYQRLMDEVSDFTGHSQQLGNLSKEQVMRKIKGSERTILNPIEATVFNTSRIVNEAQRNIAARKIAENIFPENRLRKGQMPRTGHDMINFMENGKKVSYEVPKLVAEEMRRLNRVLPDGVDKIVNVLSAPTKTLRAGATSLNPMFTASNLIRDQLQTTITGNIGANLKGTPKALLATFGWGEKAESLRGELQRQGVIGSEYRQVYGYKQGDLMKELQKEHRLDRKVADKLRHPIEALNDLIGKTEYFTRAQQYFGTEGDAITKSQAARNNTLNFSRGGSAVMVLNKIVPFLNAGVQGGRQITNQFAKRPVRTTLALFAWAGIAAAAKGFSATDEKKRELYDRVSDYEKRTNLILFSNDAKYNPETGRVDGLIKVPIPQFLYPITDSINNTKGNPEDFLQIAGNIFEVFTGIDANNPVNQLTPTAMKPFIETATNTNMFTGREIVSKYDAEKDPWDKGKKYTTGVARSLSKLTGVDAPVIDNFIQNWSGGLGKDLAKTLTDNPDNRKDGGGIGKLFTEGTYRRFGSAGADSQYVMMSEKSRELKRILESDPEFRKLSKEDQEKIKIAITQDSERIGGVLGKMERGEKVEKELSERQKDLLNGYISEGYVDRVLNGSRAVDRDRVYKENDYEYRKFKEDYDKKVREGKYSDVEKIKADKRLKKLEVGKDFSKKTRDIYNELGKNELRETLEGAEDSEKLLQDVLAYGDALVNAGISERNKFRDKYGNVDLRTKSGKRVGARADRITKEQARIESQRRIDAIKAKLPPVHRIPTMKLMGLVNNFSAQKMSGKHAVRYQSVVSSVHQGGVRSLGGGKIRKR